MPTIIISSNLKEEEQEIAERIAGAKKYQCIGPQILSDIEQKYHMEKGTLRESLDETPSFFKKIVSNKWKYHLACLEAEVLDFLKNENTVCWGLAAHLFVTGVSHVLKVRVIHTEESRIKKIVKDEGLSAQRARKLMDMENAAQKKWSISAFDRDETDLSFYDLVINLDQIDLDEAVASIISAASYRKFQPVTYSIKCLNDLAIAAKVRITLLKSMDDVQVQVKDGTVLVYTKVFKQKKIDKIREIKDLAGQVNGVEYVEVHVNKKRLQDAEAFENI